MSNKKESDINLILVYNFAPLYREPIFKLIDNNWGCHWIFGKNKSDIKEMDTSNLYKVTKIDNKQILGNFYIQKGLNKLLKEENDADILMLGEIYNISSWLVLFSNIFRRKKRKIYLWSHGWYGREDKIKKVLKNIYFGLANKTFLYGNYAKQIAIKQRFPEKKLFVIHNSLDYDNQLKIRDTLIQTNIYKNHFKNDNYNLIFIGRLTKVKKLDLLIKALYKLKQQNIEYNLTLIGSGEEDLSLRDLVKQYDLKNQVWFFGSCYDDNINAELIYNADLCVAPGNVGLTAMHTMVFGTPVISHDDFKWQMPEFEAIIPGKTGDFFIKDNIESLILSLKKWFEGPGNNRNKVRQECIKEIEDSWNPHFQLDILKKHIND